MNMHMTGNRYRPFLQYDSLLGSAGKLRSFWFLLDTKVKFTAFLLPYNGLYFTSVSLYFTPVFSLSNSFTMAMTSSDKLHLGRKVVRIRELRGMKQESLAEKLGVSQQTISKLENSEFIDEDRLKVIAEALQVTPDIIRHFNEDALFNNIQNNSDAATNNVIVNYQLSPIDKIVELYDKLLQSKQEQIKLLEELLSKERER